MQLGDTVWCVDRNDKIRRGSLVEKLNIGWYKVRLEEPDEQRSEWFMKEVFATEAEAQNYKAFKLLARPTPVVADLNFRD